MKYIFLLIFTISTNAVAQDYGLITLKEASVDYKNFAMLNSHGYDVMTYPDPPKEGLNLNLKLDILDWFYLDPTIESWTTDSQYRGIGLEVHAGIRVSEHLELGIMHHSQHQLDRGQQLPMGHFPEEDAVELKIYLYKEKSERKSVF